MRSDIINVELEGEFFTGMSFANINEQIALQLIQDSAFSVSLQRRNRYATHDAQFTQAALLKRLMNAHSAPDVSIRHVYPPSWEPPGSGVWVQIQPWEYGAVPLEWAEAVRDRVDELWAPSRYVRDCYRASGVPAEKIQVIPWGVDPAVFHARVTPLPLPTKKSFVILFVGPPVWRKGFDRLLDAYLAEFSQADDICLVVKDNGGKAQGREASAARLRIELANPNCPEIVSLGDQFTSRRLAGLYAASNVLAAPYRGEGFCLPVLEAMACGVPAIIPTGGPTDDFATPDTAFVLPSEVAPITADQTFVWHRRGWRLDGTPTELALATDDIRGALRQAYEDPRRCRQLGQRASVGVAAYTWANSVRMMKDRLHGLTAHTV